MAAHGPGDFWNKGAFIARAVWSSTLGPVVSIVLRNRCIFGSWIRFAMAS
jgi:hypothetical protein